MSKLQKSVVGFCFYCPGCKGAHIFYTKPWEKSLPKKVNGKTVRDERGEIVWVSEPGPVWQFDGNVNSPTFSPSLLIYEVKDEGTVIRPRCHLFLRAGVLEYLSDCGHELAGKKVPLPDWKH